MSCIVIQVHIPEFDVQGHLTKKEKKRRVEFAIRHIKKFNPKSYIIITGHGARPSNLDTADWYKWNEVLEKLDQHGYVKNMPAQYKYVSWGIEHAKSKGFENILKTRGDTVIGIPNITQHCQEIIETENKKLLITQQTGHETLGDCFMYGDTEILSKTWHHQNKVEHEDGLKNTAINFRKALNSTQEWKKLLQETCAFRNVNELKFTDIRWNKIDDLEPLMNEKFNFEQYHWGKATNWHHFDKDGNMTGAGPNIYWSKKQFYES